MNIKVALCNAVKSLNTFALEAEHFVWLCSRRNGIFNIAVKGRNTHLNAEASLNNADVLFVMNIVAVTDKVLVVLNDNTDSKVARRSAVYTGIAQASCRNNLIVVNTGRNVDVNLCFSAYLTSAGTFCTRLVDNFTRTVTGWARSC